MNKLKVNEGYIQFYIYSEDRMEDGLYDYEKFIAYMINKGCKKYDATHIIIPPLTKVEIKTMIEILNL